MSYHVLPCLFTANRVSESLLGVYVYISDQRSQNEIEIPDPTPLRAFQCLPG